MSTGRVLSLCDYTSNAVIPWSEAGYRCICVDLQHPSGFTTGPHPNITFVGCDVTRYPVGSNSFDMVLAFPPCTDLAVSGARWFKEKGMKKLIQALIIVERCREICEASGAPYMIENPVSTLSTYWRKPDYMFDPCDYAGYLADPAPEAYTKKTCLWTGNGFIMPEQKRVEPVLGSKMHLLPPSDERADLRSETPKGFARAVFEANYSA